MTEEKKPDPLTEEQCDNILTKISQSLPSAPDKVRGAVTLLASQDQDNGVFGIGFMNNPLRPEIYRRARAVLNKWLVDLFTDVDVDDVDGAEDDTTKHTG